MPGAFGAVPIPNAGCAGPPRSAPTTCAAFGPQWSERRPAVNDGVGANLALRERVGGLAADALVGKVVAPSVANRAMWRADERRAMREGKLHRPG